MNTFELSAIRDGICFNKDVLLDMLFIVEPAGVAIPNTVIAALADWEFNEVISEGNVNVDDFIATHIKAGTERSKTSESVLSSGIKRSLEDVRRMRTLENSEQARLAAVQNVYDEYMNYIDLCTRTMRRINKSITRVWRKRCGACVFLSVKTAVMC